MANVLYVGSPVNLGVRLGIKLPQSVLGKIVTSQDGGDLFASSESGLIHLPISTLYDNPIIQPETTQVFLAVDDCNKGIARTTVNVTNAGPRPFDLQRADRDDRSGDTSEQRRGSGCHRIRDGARPQRCGPRSLERICSPSPPVAEERRSTLRSLLSKQSITRTRSAFT